LGALGIHIRVHWLLQRLAVFLGKPGPSLGRALIVVHANTITKDGFINLRTLYKPSISNGTLCTTFVFCKVGSDSEAKIAVHAVIYATNHWIGRVEARDRRTCDRTQRRRRFGIIGYALVVGIPSRSSLANGGVTADTVTQDGRKNGGTRNRFPHGARHNWWINGSVRD
jgi:hypothetical protein